MLVYTTSTINTTVINQSLLRTHELMETKQQIETIIKKLSPFNQMDDKAVLQLLHNKARVLSLPPKQYLFRQGVKDSNTFYLLSGSLIIDQNGKKARVKAGSSITRSPLFPGEPRKCSAISEDKCVILAIDKKILDTALTWNQIADMEKTNGMDDADSGSTETWMSLMLSSRAFMQLPPSNIQALLMCMEEKKYKTGDFVVKQGEQGDFFYFIRSGECRVMRIVNDKEHAIATLTTGDSFGEEALLTGAGRNANIVMKTNGSMMRLNKEDFHRLLRPPLLKSIKKQEADEMVIKDKAQWLDVRLDNEYKQDHIEGSINIPLFMLRLKADTLKPDIKYILYCDTGQRSMAGTFILRQNGNQNAYHLNGGLDKMK